MTAADTTLAESTLARAYQDMETGNIDRLMTLYTEDALIQSAGQAPVTGTSAIRAFWRATFDQCRDELVPEVREVASFDEIVVVRGRAKGMLAPRNAGAPTPVDTWFMQIYRRQQDGTLRFWRGTNGPNPQAGATQ